MAKIFLDTNYFIDAIHRQPEKDILSALKDSIICASTLSVHIYCYTFKIKIPSPLLLIQIKKFYIVALSEDIALRSLTGPTEDFEDNVQLHSATEAECDLFITHDQELLNLKFFGKTRIVSDLANNQL